MHSLFLSLLNDRHFINRVHLLEFIKQSDTPVTLQEVADHSEISVASVRKEFKIINDEMKGYLEISSPYRSHFLLELSEGTSFEYVLTQLAKQTLVYQINEKLLNNQSARIEDFATQIGSSRSTLIRIINHMNIILQKYHLRIRTDVVSFCGSEEDIRAYLFHFFCCFSKPTILEDNAEYMAQHFIAMTCEQLQEKLRFGNYHLAIWLSILKRRWHHRCLIHVTP